ncbi:MAG: LptF/LptG family permease [Pseudomonadota bacterium]
MTWTLGSYIARRFLTTAVLAFLAVLLLVVIVGLVERLSDNADGRAGFADLLAMALLQAPSVTLVAAPFTVLLAAMACFARLARSSELVVARASGVSAWGMIGPAVLGAAALGVVGCTVYNPVAASFSERFEALEERYFGRSSSTLSVSTDGLWLRQGAAGEAGTQTVIRAERASRAVDRLWSVTVIRFDAEDRLADRIEARHAVLETGQWRLNAVRHWRLDTMLAAAEAAGDTAIDLPGAGDGPSQPAQPDGAGDAADATVADTADATAADATVAEARDVMRIPTDLTPERIVESFAPPETIGFWALSGFIEILESSGLATERHRLQWHRLVSLPVIFMAMVMIGAAFSMRPTRFGGLGGMALGCVATGFGYFFLSDLAQALGATGAIPVAVAAWAPPASAVLLALGLLLHVEDG